MTIIGEAWVLLRPETAGFARDAQAKINSQMSGLPLVGGGAGAGSSGGGVFGAMKTGALAVVVAALAASAASIKLASDFQKAAAQLQGESGMSAAEVNRIGDAMLATGGKSTFTALQMMQALAPVAAQLATVQHHVLTVSESMTFLRAATDLAEASGGNLTDTAAALAQVMQAYGTHVKGAAETSNTLYNISRLLNVPVSSLATVVSVLHAKLQDIAPSLNDVGSLMLRLVESGAVGTRALRLVAPALEKLLTSSSQVSNEVAKQTTTAQKAVTTATNELNNAQQALADTQQKYAGLPALTAAQQIELQKAQDKVTAATAKQQTALANLTSAQAGGNAAVGSAQATLHNLGIEVYNSAHQYVGLQSVLGQLHTAFQGLSQQQQQQALVSLFGTSSAQLMGKVIAGGLPAWKAATDQITKHGMVTRAATINADAMHGRLEKLRSLVEDLAIRWGRKLIPVLESFVSKVTEGILVAVNWAEHSKELHRILTDVGHVLETVGRAIGQGVGAFVHWAETSKGLHQVLKDLIHGVIDLFTVWLPAIASATRQVALDVYGFFTDIIGPIVGWVEHTWEAISNWWHRYGAEIEKVTRGVFGAIAAFVRTQLRVLVELVKGALDIIIPIFRAGWAVVKGVTQAAWDLVVGAVKVAWRVVQAVVEVGWHLILGIFEVAIDLLTGHWSKAWHDVVHTVESIRGVLINAVKGIFEAVIHAIGRAAVDLAKAAWNAGRDLIEGLAKGMWSMFKHAVNIVKDIAHGILGAFKSIFSIFSPAGTTRKMGQQVVEGLSEGMKDRAAHPLHVMRASRFKEGVEAYLAEVCHSARVGGRAIMDDLASGIHAGAPGVLAVLEAAFAGVGGSRGSAGASGPSGAHERAQAHGQRMLEQLVRMTALDQLETAILEQVQRDLAAQVAAGLRCEILGSMKLRVLESLEELARTDGARMLDEARSTNVAIVRATQLAREDSHRDYALALLALQEERQQTALLRQLLEVEKEPETLTLKLPPGTRSGGPASAQSVGAILAMGTAR